MKTLIITATILLSSLFNNTYGKGTVNINEILQGIVIFEKGALPIKKNSTEFVKISFTINERGKIEILEMNYSDESIKTQLVSKLSEMNVDEDHDTKKVYNYNFTFKKI